MQVASQEPVEELRFYSIEEICKAAGNRSRRMVDLDRQKEGCPLVLKWIGKRKVCDSATLRAYLQWLWDRASA